MIIIYFAESYVGAKPVLHQGCTLFVFRLQHFQWARSLPGLTSENVQVTSLFYTRHMETKNFIYSKEKETFHNFSIHL